MNIKVKVLSRNPDDYLRETKHDIHRRKIQNMSEESVKPGISSFLNLNLGRLVLYFSYW